MDVAVIDKPAFDSTDSLKPSAPMRQVRRHIDPQSGRALEILSHAIEYLTDEYVHEFGKEGRGSFSSGDARVQAVQLLMAASRKIYFQCPRIEGLATRCLNILRGRHHRQSDTYTGN